MTDESNEKFRGEVLKITGQQGEEIKSMGEKIDKFIEASQNKANKITGKPSGSDFSYATSIVISGKEPATEMQLQAKTQEVAQLLAPIMEKYKLSSLECSVIRIYE